MNADRVNPVFGLSQNRINIMKLTSTQNGMLGEAIAATQLMSLSNGGFSKSQIIKVNETNLQRACFENL